MANLKEEDFHFVGFHEVERIRLIASGSFGHVYEGKCRGKQVAVKVLQRELDEKTLATFESEVNVLRRVRHPNVALFMAAVINANAPAGEQLMLVTEYVPRGDVETLLHDSKVTLSLVRRMRMAREAAQGMQWIHAEKILHRDLKSSNLLADEHLHVKVCDFGLSQVMPAGAEHAFDERKAKGTPLWMAPEVMSFRAFNHKCDVYSYAIVLWELMTRAPPFAEFKQFDAFRQAVVTQHVRPVIAPSAACPFVSETLAQLLQSAWAADPAARPDFVQIVPALGRVVLECACRNEVGRAFWQACFDGRDEVPWAEFLPHFLAYLNVNQEAIHALTTTSAADARAANNVALAQAHRNIACLAALMVERADQAVEVAQDVVSIERFGRTMDLVAPLAPSTELLDAVQGVLAERWFFGHATTSDAMRCLAGYPAGTYLVRFSSGDSTSCTISKVTAEGEIKHIRVRHAPSDGGFVLNRARYQSLQTLIETAGTSLHLVIPCPGWPYQSLFVDAAVNGGYEEVTRFTSSTS